MVYETSLAARKKHSFEVDSTESIWYTMGMAQATQDAF